MNEPSRTIEDDASALLVSPPTIQEKVDRDRLGIFLAHRLGMGTPPHDVGVRTVADRNGVQAQTTLLVDGRAYVVLLARDTTLDRR